MATEKRFRRYLLDGGFWFEEYVKPVWTINDTIDTESPIKFLQFRDEEKELCDELVDYFEDQHKTIQQLQQYKDSLATGFDKYQIMVANTLQEAYNQNARHHTPVAVGVCLMLINLAKELGVELKND